MVAYILNKRFYFIVVIAIALFIVVFVERHRPRQYFPSSVSLNSDDRVVSLRKDDFLNHVADQLLYGIRHERPHCPPGPTTQPVATTRRSTRSFHEKLRTIYIITPTYKRPEQIPDLTRLSHTLMNVPSILWLIIEDSEILNPNVADIARRSGIPFIHLVAPMPVEEQKKKNKRLGVSNRNRGLQWIRENDVDPTGIIYFADDENTYDLRLFEEIRTVKTLGMFPVGLSWTGVSTPIVKNGVVKRFYDGRNNGQFPVDVAGFAVSVQLILKKPKVKMSFMAGHGEGHFLHSLQLKRKDIEPKASNCTKIYVWRTQTYKNRPPVKMATALNDTNIDILYKFLGS